MFKIESNMENTFNFLPRSGPPSVIKYFLFHLFPLLFDFNSSHFFYSPQTTMYCRSSNTSNIFFNKLKWLVYLDSVGLKIFLLKKDLNIAKLQMMWGVTFNHLYISGFSYHYLQSIYFLDVF